MTRKCSFCQAMNPDDAVECSVCFKKLGTRLAAPREEYVRRSEYVPFGRPLIPRSMTKSPIYAGAILIFVGVLNIGQIILANLIVSHFYEDYADSLAAFNAIVGSLTVFAMIGGALTMTRKLWGLCLAAGIVSAFLSLLIGGLIRLMLSIGAVAFIAMSKDEFD